MTTHEETSLALAAYAVHAVDTEEAAQVETHLDGCERCRTELADFYEVAAFLGQMGDNAPDRVWDRVAARIEADPEGRTDRPVPLLGRNRAAGFVAGASSGGRSSEDRSADGASSRSSGSSTGGPDERDVSPAGPPGKVVPFRAATRRRVAAVLAVAAAVAIVVLAVQVVHLGNRVAGVSSASGRTPSGIAPAAGARRFVLTSTATHREVAEVVALPDGSAYLMDSRMPALGSRQTYQLWAVHSSSVVSLGLLGPNPSVAPFTLDAGSVHATLALTVEPTGGTMDPTSAPVAES